MDEVVNALKAAGEPSRLRILAILEHHELTVTELVAVLRQSQPRVSRHLRVLSEAGLVRRHAEGTSAFYRLHRAGPHAPLVRAILDSTDPTVADLARDAERLRQIREARGQRAAAYFRDVAADWDRMRNRHVPDAHIEAALVELLETQTATGSGVGTLLDLGTGTGRILEVAGPSVTNGLGIDFSRDMLAVARDKLESAELHNCQVRLGDLYNLDLGANSADMAVLHHVLHFLDDPADVIAEAARVLRPGGTLVVIDFAPHSLDTLRDDYAHVRLGFSTDEIASWFQQAALGNTAVRDFVPDPTGTDMGDGETLTVAMWTATKPGQSTPDAKRSEPTLEVAS